MSCSGRFHSSYMGSTGILLTTEPRGVIDWELSVVPQCLESAIQYTLLRSVIKDRNFARAVILFTLCSICSTEGGICSIEGGICFNEGQRICSIEGRSEGLAFQHCKIRSHVSYSILGLSNRGGRTPTVTSRKISYSFFSTKGMVSNNI